MLGDLPKGDVPLLVLSVLAEGGRHGYAIAREIERISKDNLQLREGTLYPALRVLEQDGLIAGEWQIQPSGPARKVYTLTDKGIKERERRAREWQEYANFMQLVLGGKRTSEQTA